MMRVLSALFSMICVLALPHVAAAQPVGAVDLMFSTDGGTTFTDAATVDEMESFLLRVYFDNTGDQPGTAASVAMTLPAGFVRTGASTRVCVEPNAGEIVCNEDVGQTGAIDESSVWSGQALTISPTAGLYGAPAGATAGLLEIGKLAFVNLHDCHYFNGVERFFTTADPDIAGTNVANVLDVAAACAGVVGAYGNAGQELRSAGLLAQRYLNYHECHYNFLTDHIYRIADGTGTSTSNAIAAAPNCAGTAGAHVLHPDSTVLNFDLFGNRYLNLWECRYISGGDLVSLNSTGSNTSNSPDPAPSCPATIGAYTLNDADHLVLDTLDTSRGRGFVEVTVAAATTGAGTFDIDSDLDAAEFATLTDTGMVTVLPAVVTSPMPTVDLRFSQDCDTTFTEDAEPHVGETFLTRVYFGNVGDAAGADAQVTTDLPAGFDLVPGSTRVCLEPSAGEQICNTDLGQGGAIDEAAVWTAGTLTIAPAAGIGTVAANATSGFLEVGRKRYLNLHECQYFDGLTDRFFLTVGQGAVGTNASNTPDLAATCPTVAHGGTLVGSEAYAFDLSGQRYLNVHECQYQFLLDRIFLTGSSATGTSASNGIDPTLACRPTAGAHAVLPAESNLLTLDLEGQRFVNLHECVMINGTDHIAMWAGGANGTNAANSADTLVQCPSVSGAHNLVTGSVAALDLLDPTRGGGFVEFRVTATVDTLADLNQTVTLVGSNFTAANDTGVLRATAGRFFRGDFECGTTERWTATVP